jgi:hypothetical protein
LRDGAVVLAVKVHLAARDWAAGNEGDESLGRQRPRKPFAVVTRLELLWGINPEQANELTTKLYCVSK